MTTAFCTCGHDANDHLAATQCVRCPCSRFNDATTEYTEDLAAVGGFAMTQAKRAFAEVGGITPFFVFKYPDDHLDIVVLPPPLNDIIAEVQTAKQLLFDAMRRTISRLDVVLAVFVADAWCGRPSPKAASMSADGFIQAVKDDLNQAEKDGVVERVPALVATVQTPERMLIMVQFYGHDIVDERDRITWGERMQLEANIDEYEGATKLFGKQKVTQ